MKATKITIVTDENVALVLEGEQAQTVFNQVRWSLYPQVQNEDSIAIRDKIQSEISNRYTSPYASYVVIKRDNAKS